MKKLKKISIIFLSLSLSFILFIGLLNSTASAESLEDFSYNSSYFYNYLAEKCAEYAMLAYDEMEMKS